MKDAVKLLGTALAIIILAVILGPHLVSTPTPTPPEPPAEAAHKTEIRRQNEARAELFEVYELAKDSVRDKLKAPATAKFPSLGLDEDAKIAPYGYHQWLCSGFVDAQNSFGANLRYKWGVYIFKSETTWHADYIELDNEVYGKLPASIPFPLTPEQIAAAEKAAATNRAVEKQKARSNEQRALESNQSAAEKGDAYGLLRMGERYRDGDGVAKDLPKAREYFTKAIAAGSPSAQEELDQLPK